MKWSRTAGSMIATPTFAVLARFRSRVVRGRLLLHPQNARLLSNRASGSPAQVCESLGLKDSGS